ncbi:MAG: diaminopimelate epimerase [Nitrospiraceae bacterium]|jgi:diaminopimelate epimerase|nr:diaminopimelate epimerase [Nitrospiraceae bacterium]
MALDQDFIKSHGLGNDYIVMTAPPSGLSWSPEMIQLICDRNYGVGSDGILLLTRDREPFGLRIFNPDGSEAEKSGNGLRIFAKFLYEYGYAKGESFQIETLGGMVSARVTLGDDRLVKRVLVDMGSYTMDPEKVGVKGALAPHIEKEIDLGQGVRISGTAVSVGNPHFVFFVDQIDEDWIRKWGSAIENNPLFPRRINTQMVKVTGEDQIEIRIWERGAGYTLASGSSSCAAASVSVHLGKVKSPVRVTMPGGELTIDVSKSGDVRMEGPVSSVMSGRFSSEFLKELQKCSAQP